MVSGGEVAFDSQQRPAASGSKVPTYQQTPLKSAPGM